MFSLSSCAILAGTCLILYILTSIVYNLCFSPLRSIPGPKLWAISQIFYSRLLVSGEGHKHTLELHKKYGEVVRLSPDMVSVVNHKVWKDLLGPKKVGEQENCKDSVFYFDAGGSIAGDCETKAHNRQRKLLAPAFSAQSMMDQQPLITKYVDLLLEGLRVKGLGGTVALDMTQWYNWTTFDIIGDLTFGEPFDCLAKGEYHSWIAIVFGSIAEHATLVQIRRNFPYIDLLLKYLLPKSLTKLADTHSNLTNAKLAKRMALGNSRPDFMEVMLRGLADGKITNDAIAMNAKTLIIAGSETTAVTLDGATYLLCTHPEVLAKLTAEVRSSFTCEDDIDLSSVGRLKYMLAVLDESMRMFGATAGGLPPRVIRKGGDVICGRFLPEGTKVVVSFWAINYWPGNFDMPEQFLPERWLGDPRFDHDHREAFQPWSYGPRNCLGQNLAYAEMRLILARIIWSYDMKMADPNEKWIDNNRTFVLWEKTPLNIYLVPRSE